MRRNYRIGRPRGYVPRPTDEYFIYETVLAGNIYRVRELVIRYPELASAKDPFAWSALHMATRHNYLDIINFLCERGADVNQTDDNDYPALFYAIENGDLKTAKALLALGANPNYLNAVSAASSFFLFDSLQRGESALMVASSGGHKNIARKLISNGAHIHFQNQHGDTAISIARTNGHENLAEYLESWVPNVLNRHR